MGKSTIGKAGASRRRFIQTAGAAAAVASLPGLSLAQPERRPPNILFILADDLGYADLSCYGRREYKTPVLDRLAADGLLMTQGYSNSAVCSPTRVALITGRYHQRLRVGMEEPIRAQDSEIGLSAEQPTLPSLLKKTGYRTALVGKWHMGWPPEYSPLKCGYDSFFGVAVGAADYFSHREHNLVEADRPGLYEGDKIVRRTGYLTELLAERAIEELRGNARVREPFLLSLHFTAPHWPWQGPGDAGTSADISNLRHDDGGSFETFGKMVTALDDAIGRVLAELERQGFGSNTLVVFTSDNGGERFSDVWPLRGGKGELLEGGIRVPLIVRWPDRIPAASRSDQVMASMDWLPTLIAATGGSTDPRFPPDGENLLDVITGASAARSRKIYWRFRNKGQAAVREGDWKFLRVDGKEGLFNIPADPRENANLRERDKDRFERLRADFAAWEKGMLAYPPQPPPPVQPTVVRVG